MTNPLKWHGGKHYLAQKIIDLMPPHTRYVEPYFGGGAVLFRKNPEGVSEFVNDINTELTNFWSVLKNPLYFEAFSRILSCTPLSEVEWKLAMRLEPQVTGGPVDRAVRFFVRYRQSRQGLAKSFCTPTSRTRRGMNENVSAWLSAVDELPEAHQRLRRVEIRSGDALKLIRELDSPETLFYLDPPYLHETRVSQDAYENEMKEQDHASLLDLISRIKGKFILSGYQSQLYERYRVAKEWRTVDIGIDNKASSKAVKDIKVERLWMNY